MSEPLSIAMLSHLASRQAPTGAERSLVLLANGLAGRDHRVAVGVPASGALERLMDPAIEVRRIPCRMCWLTHFEPEPLVRTAARWARYAWPDPGEGQLTRWIRETRPAAVHVNCLPHLRGARAARRAGRPVVWHVREILPPGPRRRWLASRVAADAHTVVAVSEAVAAWLREEGLGDRVAVVPNGVEIPASVPNRAHARRTLGIPDDSTVVGLFGQIRPHKGIADAIDAVASARARASKVRLVIAGSGPLRFLSDVDRAAAERGLKEAFQRLPGIDDPTMLYAASDVVLLTTRTPDPLPRSVLEAMAQGRPVAAFRSGGTAEMVVDGRTGLLVDVGDVKSLAGAIGRLAGDDALRAAMGAAALARAREHFSIEQHVRRMEEILRAAAAQ